MLEEVYKHFGALIRDFDTFLGHSSNKPGTFFMENPEGNCVSQIVRETCNLIPNEEGSADANAALVGAAMVQPLLVLPYWCA